MVYLNLCCCIVFFFKHKTAYVVRISDWSSDVCSSDLEVARVAAAGAIVEQRFGRFQVEPAVAIVPGGALAEQEARIAALGREAVDRKSVVSGKSVSVHVDLGCRRLIIKKQVHYYYLIDLYFIL